MKNRTVAMLIISLFVFIKQSDAQIDTAWIRTWDSQLWDEAHAVTTDVDNNVYVAGWNYEWGINFDFIFAKYDAGGNLIWSKTKNYWTGDQASHIVVGPDGYLYIAGFVNGSYSTTGGSMTLMKYTVDGDSIWEFVDNNFGLTQISEMAFDHSGNIVLAGFVGTTLGSAEYLTMKVDTNGNQLWYQTYNNYGPNQSNRIYGICVDELDNIYVTGACDDTTYFSTDVVTIKYNSNGDTIWKRHFNAPSNNYDVGDKIIIDPNGDLIIGGQISTSGPAQTDYMILKYDTAGNMMCNKYFNYPGPQSFDVFKDMKLDASGNIYLLGNSSTNNAQNTIRVETIKFNNNGDTVWTARWGTASDYQPQKFILDSINNIYITGFYYDSNTGTGYNAFTIKYDSSGVLKWEAYYNDSTNQEENLYDLALDANNDLIVVGRTHSSSVFDFVTIKYKNVLSGIPMIEAGYPSLQMSCYPNPFNGLTFINYYLPSASETILKIIDLSGKEVFVSNIGMQPSGNYIFQYNATMLKAGIYNCQLISNNQSISQRIIMLNY